MTPQDRLKEIEIHFKNMNNFGWPEDVKWLIARCKQLEKTLNYLGMLQMGEIDYTKDFFEICKTEIRNVLDTMPEGDK